MDEKINSGTDSTPRWGLWGTLFFGFLLLGVWFILDSALTGVYVGITGRAPSYAEATRSIEELQFNGFVISICAIISSLVCGTLLVAIIKLKKGASIKEYLGLVRFNSNQVLRWGGLLIALLIVTDISFVLFGLPIIPEFQLLIYKSAKYPLILWFAIVIFAPLFEECFFRGFLLKGLSLSFLKPVGAVLTTSVVWAGIHGQYGLRDIVPIFIFGCLLGAARVKTGSVSITITLHSFANLVSLIETMIYIKMNMS